MLGSGEFADVYKGTLQRGGKTNDVAVKMLKVLYASYKWKSDKNWPRIGLSNTPHSKTDFCLNNKGRGIVQQELGYVCLVVIGDGFNSIFFNCIF